MKKLICLILALFMLIFKPTDCPQQNRSQEPVEPKVKAISAVSMDLAGSGEIILAQRSRQKMYPAPPSLSS